MRGSGIMTSVRSSARRRAAGRQQQHALSHEEEDLTQQDLPTTNYQNSPTGTHAGDEPHESGEQDNEPLHNKPSAPCKGCLQRGVALTIPYWVLALATVVGTIVLGLEIFHLYQQCLRPRFYVPPEVMQDMGLDGVIMFRQHDRDQDGVLDLTEFEPLAHRLLELNITHQYELTSNSSDELVTLQAFFTPLHLSSMSKDIETRPHGLDPLSGLKRWRSVAKASQQLAARHFEAWLPEDDDLLDRVGEVYDLVGVPEELGQGITISANRYVPPRLTEPADVLVHVLLAMFHPRPFVMSRFMPHGSMAIVRASNSHTVDIVFRIHAEYQVNEAPFNPFWFTPAQFTGHLTIDRDARHMHQFTLCVPNERKLNVDMEWLTGQMDDQNMEVDIGYVPEMVINITGPSVLVMDDPGDPAPDEEDTSSGLQWTHEISMEEAIKKLEVKMYPFMKIPYYNMTKAFDLANVEDKLVHHILLWGALDDQSC